MIESVIAFLLILLVAVVIYLGSNVLIQKTPGSEEQVEMYACGEKVVPQKLLVNVSLYKYLIYFVIIDSPALIAGFAAMSLEIINPFYLLVYLGIILVADLMLLGVVEHA
ncbi:MAG: hypothetical protein WC325_06180 [Candidatus Bathyarchaeia archaeon]